MLNLQIKEFQIPLRQVLHEANFRMVSEFHFKCSGYSLMSIYSCDGSIITGPYRYCYSINDLVAYVNIND